jgi:hypothetical protein
LDSVGQTSKSLVRIVRAATGAKHLAGDEIALQYEDRLTLGVELGSKQDLLLRPANEWIALPKFFLGHPSPFERRTAVFSLALTIAGTVIGFLAGLAF